MKRSIGTILIIVIVLFVSGMTVFFASKSAREVTCPSRISVAMELSGLEAHCYSLGDTGGMGVLSTYGSQVVQIKLTWGTSFNNGLDFVIHFAKTADWDIDDLKCATDMAMNSAPEANRWHQCGSIATSRLDSTSIYYMAIVP